MGVYSSGMGLLSGCLPDVITFAVTAQRAACLPNPDERTDAHAQRQENNHRYLQVNPHLSTSLYEVSLGQGVYRLYETAATPRR